MTYDLEKKFRDSVSDLALKTWTIEHGPLEPPEKSKLLQLVEYSHIIAHEAGVSQQRWIDAARRCGASWAEIGGVLGISRQAAQQRFGTASYAPPSLHGGRALIERSATAFNEMGIMAEEGAQGRELVGLGPMTLAFIQSECQWEYRRELAIASAAKKAHLSASGWLRSGTWYPFLYFKRPLTSEDAG